jgi:hypothetical protein
VYSLIAGATEEPKALTEKEKKLRRDRIEKEVAVFLQRRPPNSTTSTIRSDGKKPPGKYIDCHLNYDVIEYCVSFLENPKMLQLEGIYRISGNSDSVRAAWAAFCLGYFDYVEWQHEVSKNAKNTKTRTNKQTNKHTHTHFPHTHTHTHTLSGW